MEREMDNATVRPGMKPWTGGDRAPEDWDKNGWLECRDHHRFRVGDGYSVRWVHNGSQFDIIAYTPRTPPPAAHDDAARAREALAQAYEVTEDAQGDSPRYHAANVRVIGRRDYADWKDRAAIAAMLAHTAAETAALRAENERLREALEPSGATKAAYHGEFTFNVMVPDADDDNDELVPMKVYVPWFTVKEIMTAIGARAANLTKQPTE